MRKGLVLWVLLAGGLITFSCPSSTLALDMQEGKWEITMQMQGMPMAMPPMTHVQCITKEDMIPQQNTQGSDDCQIVKTNVNGNTVSWEMVCNGPESAMESTGQITYKGSSFDGVIKMTINEPGQGKMQMTNVLSGRRIGDCN